MNTYERLESEVKARGVRVAERLEIIRMLQSHDGTELVQTADKHQRAIQSAAKKVREALS